MNGFGKETTPLGFIRLPLEIPGVSSRFCYLEEMLMKRCSNREEYKLIGLVDQL